MHKHYHCQKSRSVSTISNVTEIKKIHRYRWSTKCVSFEHKSSLFIHNQQTWSMLHLSNRVIVKEWEGNFERLNIMLKTHAHSLPSTLSQVFILGTYGLPFKIKVKLINLEHPCKHFMTTKLILNEFIMINIITIYQNNERW